MRQKTRIIALLLVVCLLTACSIPFAYPDGGEFYCEELQMTLDFSSKNNEATFTDNGKEISGYFMTGFDARIYVEYAEYTADGPIYHDVLVGDFKYRSGKVTVKTDDGHKYTFLPVEE